MIAYLKGKIQHKSANVKKDNFLIVNVNGVGYKAYILDKLLTEAKSGEEIEIFIYTQVAETALDLFGFKTKEELDFFESLISISGIGPRSAMDILQKAKIEDLKTAVMSNNPEVLSKVSGIGPKTAFRVVAGLKDKFGGLDLNINEGFGDALEALIGLGYSASQARDALSRCQAEDMGEKVKQALKILGQRQC